MFYQVNILRLYIIFQLIQNQISELRKKQSILDVFCIDENGSKYIIEMQNAKEREFEKGVVSTNMDKGGKYSDLKQIICVAITDFVLFPNKKDYFSTHSICDNITHEHDLKDFSFGFIELPKFNKQNGTQRGIDEWCHFFKNAKNCKSANTIDPIIKKDDETLEMSNWTEQAIRLTKKYYLIIKPEKTK